MAHTSKLLHTSKESGLENDGELTIPTMTAVPPNDYQQNTEQTKVVCHYCKKPGHVIGDCRKGMKQEHEQRKDSSIPNMKPSTSKSFAPSRHCRQIILQKNVRVVPMSLTDPNGSNRIIQQTIEIMGKYKET